MTTSRTRRPRIAILTSADYTWAFPAWRRTIPALRECSDLVGMWLFPDRLGKRTGSAIPLWYLRTFGCWNVLLLAAFAAVIRVRSLLDGPGTWPRLAREAGFELLRGHSVNDHSVRRWLADRRIDIAFAMVGEIVDEQTLCAVTVGMINKHAALLPSCRGVYPYFWARLYGLPTGVTFHRMSRRIDDGPVLAQERIDIPIEQSMLAFYREAFDRFPRMAREALGRLVDGRSVKPVAGVEASYYGFPTPADYREFRRRGHYVVRLRDLIPIRCGDGHRA